MTFSKIGFLNVDILKHAPKSFEYLLYIRTNRFEKCIVSCVRSVIISFIVFTVKENKSSTCKEYAEKSKCRKKYLECALK